jgi:hypothetical protein
VQEPSIGPVVTLPPDGSFDFELLLPRALDEGVYLFRVTLAARSGEQSADRLEEIAFAVLDGMAHLVDDSEFFEISSINEGVLQ